MKIFHTADWHLGKLVQGVYMTEDQRYVLEQFLQAIEQERPDVVVIAGDLYDRAVPPTEAVQLLDEVIGKIVLDLETKIIAISGNHDSPSRIQFGSKVMERRGLYLIGDIEAAFEPIILEDAYGEVYFHPVPYVDPSIVRNFFRDETIRSHNDAYRKITEEITAHMDETARHVLVGHAFVTPYGEEQENTSDSERPLSIGGAEYVSSEHFQPFHYTALGHLHRAHYVTDEKIRYAGSLLKYSISEEHHKKGFYIVELDSVGNLTIEKRTFQPLRDMRTVEASLAELYEHPPSDDYVFVRLTDTKPILSPMEKVRSIYPNAMHVERKNFLLPLSSGEKKKRKQRSEMNTLELFHAFYEEIRKEKVPQEIESIFTEVVDDVLRREREED